MSITKTYADGTPFTAATATDVAEELRKITGTAWSVRQDYTATGGGWVVVRSADNADRNAPAVSGHMTGWHVYADRMRLELSGITPDGARELYLRPDDRWSDITVAAGTEASKIARAIVSRLLPAYLPKHAAIVARVTEHNSGEERARNSADLLREVSPAGSTVDAHGQYAGQRVHITMPDGYGHARVWHGGESVTLELHSLPLDVARDMLALLTARTA